MKRGLQSLVACNEVVAMEIWPVQYSLLHGKPPHMQLKCVARVRQ